MEGVTQEKNPYVKVWYSQHVWSPSDNKNLKLYKIIVEVDEMLTWAYTYDPALTKIGTTPAVEFYDNKSQDGYLCMRRRRKENSDVF